MVREFIKSELNKFLGLSNPSNIPHNKQIKSFVFFNTTEEKEKEIKKIVTSEFSFIETSLKEQRNIEIKEQLKNIDWVKEKYSNLIGKYRGTNIQSDIFEWADDAYKDEYERILSIPTRLKDITTELFLRDVNLTKFFNDNQRLELLNNTLDFSNLYRYHHDTDFQRYYTLTKNEQEYDYLNESIWAINNAKYIYCYNIDIIKYLDDFENLFRTIFKWDYLYWSVFCLPISQSEFENLASDFLKTELYYNRKVIDSKSLSEM